MASLHKKGREDGFVMIACMMIMIVLTIVGIMAVSTTQIELMISGNDKVAKSAFYRADSGIFTAPKVIREVLKVGPTVDISTMTIVPESAGSQKEFYRKVIGFNTAQPDPNISFTQGEGDLDTDILRSGQEQLPGESIEFASGYDGGPTASQGVAVLYRLSATGTAPGNAVSQITALYKFIPGRPGGL